MPIENLINDPVGFLKNLAISLPAILIALILHECAHGYVAYKCGDPTAKMLGRLSLNPLKHLDPLGTAMMLLAGIGWAKPVPVNPRNYRNYRRDDLLVSLAGITMNLILCLLFSLICQIFLAVLFANLPAGYYAASSVKRTWFEYFFAMGEDVSVYWGEGWGILYQVLSRVAVTNLSLAVFNLLPIPPLDGYHVLNDLLLKRSLFANPRFAQIASSVLFVVVIGTDWLDKLLTFVLTHVLGALGTLGYAVISAVGRI